MRKTIQSTDNKNDLNFLGSYENYLKNYFGVKYCLAVSSGTASLIVALKALDAGSKDEIIAPPTAPLCTAYPVLSTGATLRFCDIRPYNLGLDLIMLSSLINKRTKAIIEVPMWGYPTPVDELKDFARKKNIPLIFDLAHCVGTEFNNKPLSDYCDIACFSTQKNKIFSTGEGGFLLTANEEYYQKALLYSRMGELNGINFGLNYKLSNLQAKAGIEELKILDENLERRKRNSRFIVDAITHDNIKEVNYPSLDKPSYQRLVLHTKDGNKNLAAYMVSKGIPSDIEKYNIKPLYEYPILNNLKTHCPNAEELLSIMTTLSVHIDYTEKDLNHIIETINNFPN
ncbi:DegT/DnrJ/EryC1/StrS family aminotransferase [Terrimonas pollutisoli]|uniref:DegT/DnrJ/EryC1/StrS family aminotransferase n=1 Tax=Terrimonas pollutisoli TaxID=3034147 RepID=UPI0023ED26D7|nr:DegT/DnrJ/EryC1/StrS family aminotransferase [Terrimonas sp. H1YJ31]